MTEVRDLKNTVAALRNKLELEQIESEEIDPSSATLQALAAALRIPAGWLFDSPQSFECLFSDGDDQEEPGASGPDPVTERILAGSQMNFYMFQKCLQMKIMVANFSK